MGATAATPATKPLAGPCKPAGSSSAARSWRAGWPRSRQPLEMRAEVLTIASSFAAERDQEAARRSVCGSIESASGFPKRSEDSNDSLRTRVVGFDTSAKAGKQGEHWSWPVREESVVKHGVVVGLILVAFAASSHTAGQGRPDPTALLLAQKEAMNRLAILDGIWRGSAWIVLPSGDKHTFTQTERVGPFLDGSVKVIEGRGYEADGSVVFNALGIISHDLRGHEYTLHSYAQGQVGDFTVTLIEGGFRWEIPAGPMTMRYTAVIQDGTWKETGERVLPGKDPVPFFEVTLQRMGDTDWPSAGAVPPE